MKFVSINNSRYHAYKLDSVKAVGDAKVTVKALAEKLATNIPHVRVDFYQTPEAVYFGEMTFFDGSGFDRIEPIEWDYKLGSWINLPQKTQ